MNSNTNLPKGQIAQIPNGNLVEVGLSWEMTGETYDLDLTAVRFTDMGNIIDAVYFNQGKSEDLSIIHSGDERTGKSEGYDEKISIYLNKVSLDTKVIAILVNSANGATFNKVQGEQLRITIDGVPILNFNTGWQGDFTSVLAAFLFRPDIDNNPNNWMIKNIGDLGFQKDFVESMPLILSNMKFLVDEVLLKEAASWNTKTGKSFNLEKGGQVLLADCLKQIAIGLGWETFCDLDSSVFTLNAKFNLTETINYKNLKSRNGSIIHNGDNRTGAGKGDDENIILNLPIIDSKVMIIACAINVFTLDKTFNDVTLAYCRLIDWQTKTEFCKYNLNGFGPKKTCLLAYLIRDLVNNTWKLKAVGKFMEVFSIDALIAEIKLNITQGKSLTDQQCKEIADKKFESNFQVNVPMNVPDVRVRNNTRENKNKGCECRIF